MKKLLFMLLLVVFMQSCYTVKFSPELEDSMRYAARSNHADLERKLILANYVVLKEAGFTDEEANKAALKSMTASLRSLENID